LNSPTLEVLPPLRDVINAAGLRADKKFGQNFLLDLNITRKIVRLAQLPANAPVIEIGPGPGGLTRALLETGAHVTAYELDARVQPILDDLAAASGNRLFVQMKDALSVDWTRIEDNTHIVANLPYNIATPLLFQWLETSYKQPVKIASMALMFQAEVADRIVAAPGGKAYGRLAVMAQWLMECAPLLTLPPSAFTPAPKVHSTVVRFTPRMDRPKADFKTMEQVVAAAFNQRRKMIRSSLSFYEFDWDVLGIDSAQRAENLSVDDYVALSKAAST
jgi:16S rRNA (adenine1518-N6/adenine1519-N6)-dimethyltransferase